MKCWWVFIAATTLSATATAEQAWRTPGDEEAVAARRLAAAGRCADALDPFDRAVETRTGDASLRRDRGLCHERLGHPAPAIEDYRAYLSMAERAPDRGPIRARLDALEAAQAAHAPAAAAPASGGNTEGTGRSSEKVSTDGTGFLLGFHLGDRAWSSSGYPAPTVSYGIAVGYSFLRTLEAGARVVLLSTNVDKTSGSGVSLGLLWKVDLESGHRFALGLGISGGFESQKNEVGTARPLWLGVVEPTLRFLPLPELVLSLGPALGLGSIRKMAESTADAPSSSVQTTFYGGNLQILWLLGARRQSE